MAPEEVAFVRPSKVAGTSISDALGLELFERPEQIKGGLGWVDFCHMHIPSLIKKGHLPQDYNPFTFTFVRNPYDRAVSLYFYMKNYKMITPDGGYKMREEAKLDTFLDFCKQLEKKKFGPVGVHNNKKRSIFNPQWEWIKGMDIDFTGRYEQLQPDFNLLCDTLHIGRRTLGHMRATKHDHYTTYLCKESRAIINKVYKDDFKHLGYVKH